MSMPEEINRILTDRISDLLLCPTETAVDNLNNEGYKNLDISILKTGDVMQDAAIFYSKKNKPQILKSLRSLFYQPFIELRIQIIIKNYPLYFLG